MEIIEIRASRIGNAFFRMLAMAVPAAFLLLSLEGWWLLSAAWVVLLWWAWRGTFGLGAGGLVLRLCANGQWALGSAGGPSRPLTGARPILVGPHLIVAELDGAGRTFPLVVPADGGSEDDRRRLRRLLLAIPPDRQRDAEALQSRSRGA